MRIESLVLKNFKAFRHLEMRDIPAFCVIVGANGTGKSTLFSVFAFLKDAFASNLPTALNRLGGSRGFAEVRSRGADGNIEIELKFRDKPDSPLITYSLEIAEQNGSPVVAHEILKYRRGSGGQPWQFLNFSGGEGMAVTNEFDADLDESRLDREPAKLKSADILAIKGLAQFEKYPAVVALGNLIENWHISDFHISAARPDQSAGYAEHLSTEGENLALVTEFLYKRHPAIFNDICKKLSSRVPGIQSVSAKTTEEGRVLLRFGDGAFKDPFLSRFVSDGTIKMFAYMVLLYDPAPHSLLCVEEPENQLYPTLLAELAEEFRGYAKRGGQVFVSTHSPDFLGAAAPDEVFWLTKSNGYTEIKKAADDPQIQGYMKDGNDNMGYLWRQGFFDGADPE